MKYLFVIIFFGSFISPPSAEARDMRHFSPKEGFLPDEETAIAVAEIILTKIYGSDQIKEQRPFFANLKGDKWEISGSLPANKVGGTAYIELKKNGQVVRLSHSR